MRKLFAFFCTGCRFVATNLCTDCLVIVFYMPFVPIHSHFHCVAIIVILTRAEKSNDEKANCFTSPRRAYATRKVLFTVRVRRYAWWAFRKPFRFIMTFATSARRRATDRHAQDILTKNYYCLWRESPSRPFTCVRPFRKGFHSFALNDCPIYRRCNTCNVT